MTILFDSCCCDSGGGGSGGQSGIRFGQVPVPTLVTPPEAYPVTLELTKLHLRVDHTSEDDYIWDLIGAAVDWLENELDQQLITAVYSLSLAGFQFGNMLKLPRSPLQSVESVTYLDMLFAPHTLAGDVYNVVTSSRPGRIERSFTGVWPIVGIHPEAVTVNFTAGYGGIDDVPRRIKQAIYLLVGHWYEHRESVSAAGMMAASELPLAVTSIVQGARTYRF